MVRKFPIFHCEWKKGDLEVVNNFQKDFSEKLLFHLTFNRNICFFWLNGKHPLFSMSDIQLWYNCFVDYLLIKTLPPCLIVNWKVSSTTTILP